MAFIMKVLVVEDDLAIARVLVRGLGEAGHLVVQAEDGPSGLAALRAGNCDVCVLDLGLPKLDGLSVLEEARAAGVRTPVLVLTARDAVPDRVQGLRRGADDYLTKPFAFTELVARLEALVRRVAPPARIRSGDFELDQDGHRALRGGIELALSEKQFALLSFLMQHAGKVVSRAQLLDKVFGYGFDPGTNIVDVHIGHLRQKLDEPSQPSCITTVRGVGYRFEDA
jgi:two-component system, OmpR family, response regulator